ncbi:hypothetical protein B0J17DRAFT_736480, partial [Rhizoctonia solani]
MIYLRNNLLIYFSWDTVTPGIFLTLSIRISQWLAISSFFHCWIRTSSRVWDIFYHFKIGDQVLGLITRQTQTLYEYSQDTEAWRKYPCSSYLKMVDIRTLDELRSYWNKYATFERLALEQKDKFFEQQARMSARMATRLGGATVQGPSCSAGMLWPEALAPVTDLFRKYWQTGTTFTLARDIQNAKNLNSAFVYSMSGEEFLPNDGTFPQRLHLISAVAPLKSDPTGSTPTQGSAIDISKQQLKVWCESFCERRKTQNLTIRFFAGDAITFCCALDSLRVTGESTTDIFVANYRAAQIHFDQDNTTPTSFDVIDTSNLTDHVGLLNLLIVAHPLLKETPASQSVLYTESLLPFGKDPTKSFPERIYTDIPTWRCCLGLFPGHIFPISQCNPIFMNYCMLRTRINTANEQYGAPLSR